MKAFSGNMQCKTTYLRYIGVAENKICSYFRWFPECEYVLQKKGEEYVNEVHARTSANKKVDKIGRAHV